MRPTDTTTKKLMRIAEPVCTNAGYELVDLALTQSQGGWVLRVFIDYPAPAEQPSALGPSSSRDHESHESWTGDSSIGFDDCERVSRELSAVLDVEDPIPQAYHLEVSSPGVDRPLRTVAHFRRFAGQVARVKLREGIDGRRNFKGVLVAVSEVAQMPENTGDETFNVVMDVDGKRCELPLGDIEQARLVPDWDALFARSTRSGARGSGANVDDGGA